MTEHQGFRKRNRSATRGAILRAARLLFSQRSYKSVTISDVATEAGVDSALIKRYFGAKEGLFKAALLEGRLPLDVSEKEIAHLGGHLAHYFLPHVVSHDLQGTLMMVLHSLEDKEVSGLTQASIDETFKQPLAQKLASGDAQLRADLVLAQIIGVVIVRNFLGNNALAALSADALSRIITPTLQCYIQEPFPDS